ncbi:MAG: hypothetical protein M5U28_20200 [Sandaracinaceae bacterium]|nr:hypothetical protein [Sandaracinaceae bacterium]
MIRQRFAFALVISLLSAAAARADVVVERPQVRPVLTPQLAMVSAAAAPDAPAEDVASVERSAREQLAAAQTRIRRCLDRVDLRQDPLRSRTPRVELRLRFSRSGRPARVGAPQRRHARRRRALRARGRARRERPPRPARGGARPRRLRPPVLT